jgi:hypothetical protein
MFSQQPLWDPQRPVLRTLLKEMNERATSVWVTSHGVEFTSPRIPGRRRTRETPVLLLVDNGTQVVSFEALTREQFDDDTVFVHTLSGQRTQHRAIVVPPAAVPRGPAHPEDIGREVIVTVWWDKRTAILHHQLLINGVPASGRTMDAYHTMVDLNTRT